MGGPFDDQPAGRAGGNDLFLFDATPYVRAIYHDHGMESLHQDQTCALIICEPAVGS